MRPFAPLAALIGEHSRLVLGAHLTQNGARGAWPRRTNAFAASPVRAKQPAAVEHAATRSDVHARISGKKRCSASGKRNRTDARTTLAARAQDQARFASGCHCISATFTIGGESRVHVFDSE